MGRFAEDSVYSNAPSPTTGAGLAILASNQRAILELPGAQAPQLVTIADGAITPTGAFLRVDTEGQAAADDLTIINVTINDTESLHDGMIVYLQAADSGRVVTIKNTASAGGITTYDGQDVVLDTTSWLVLQLREGTWQELRNLFSKTLKGLADAAQNTADSKVTAAQAAHAAMPSGQYIDISVSNGLTYQAPADGYFYLNITKGQNGSFTAILLGKNATFGTTSRCEVKENATNPACELPCTLAVKRDDWVTFLYSADGVFHACRFYYANGTAPTI